MKKLVGILLVFCILTPIVGCSIEGNKLDKNDAIKSSATEAVAAEMSSNSNDGKPIWPTEKWSTSTPEEQGMEAGFLSNADKRINENYPNIYSLLVVRHGKLVFEKYYQGMDENSCNPVYSVTKSVMSALTGIAIKDKLIKSVDQKVADYLPEYFSQVDDKRKKDITIKNVLTMTGGLEPIDSNYGEYFSSGDWLEYAINGPLEADPGKKWAYNTGLTHILSGIITKSSKMSTLEFAQKKLFKPLGMNVQTWDRDGKGVYGGGTGLRLAPRDMARFGYLYLNNGMWDGKQIIPSEWVNESTKKLSSTESERGYGYLFWNWAAKAKVKDKTHYAYAADGAGGQYIIVVPDLDIVAVVTANLYSQSKDKKGTADIIWDYVIPSLK